MPKIEDWFAANQLSLNTDKTYYQIYTNKKIRAAISLNLVGVNIKRVKSVKYLGVFIDEDLKWHTHLRKLYTVLCRNVGIINRARYFLHSSHLLLLYNSLILYHINYCCLLFCNTYSSHIHEIEKLQKRAVRLIDGQARLAHSSPIFKKLHLLKLRDVTLWRHKVARATIYITYRWLRARAGVRENWDGGVQMLSGAVCKRGNKQSAKTETRHMVSRSGVMNFCCNLYIGKNLRWVDCGRQPSWICLRQIWLQPRYIDY